MRVLLTGAGGFVGHHFLEHILATTDWHVTCTDSFRHKGRSDRLAEVLAPHPEWRPRTDVVMHDLCAPFTSWELAQLGRIDYIIAMASESHVDRSLTDPVPFVVNNTHVILNTLELARATQPAAVLVISTDEVYGPVEAGSPGHPEWSAIIPSNPYAASKAAQEAIATSYWRAYGVPVVIANIMNMIGERQDPEKFIPKAISCIASGHVLTVHGTPGNIGTRHYLHARNVADAALFIIRHQPPAMFPAFDRPDRYNIAGPEPISNLEVARQIAAIADRDLRYRLVDFHSARPGHDPHYGLDPSKLAELGWKPPVDFAASLDRTVSWSLAHPEWLSSS